jgi:outer membrane lipase/esterase
MAWSLASGFLTASLLGFGLTVNGSASAAPTFNGLIVFGDSLSDNGNAGRFSNGPVWVERLAERLALALIPARIGGSNFAIGGARLDPHSESYNLRAQIDLFLRLPPPKGRPLFIVLGGGNDLLAAAGTSNARAMVKTAVASLKSLVTDLVDRGATDILVPNLPDVGMTPAIQERGDRAVTEAAQLTDHFNAEADRALGDFTAVPGLRLYRLDVWSLAEQVRANPRRVELTDITTPCIGLAHCEGFLFWDPVHPTTAAHDHLAEAAYRLVTGE